MSMIEVLTFQDVIIVPGKAEKEPSQVDLSTFITRKHKLSIPLLSSPMDTVTDARLAITLARIGAVGVIHRNMSIEEEYEQVKRVKDADPNPYAEVLVTEDPQEALISAKKGRPAIVKSDTDNAVVLPLGSDYKTLATKAELFLALLEAGVKPSVDESGRLLVGAAVSPFDTRRAVMLEKAGADFLVTDVAHLHNTNAIKALKGMSEEVGIPRRAGNIGTVGAV